MYYYEFQELSVLDGTRLSGFLDAPPVQEKIYFAQVNLWSDYLTVRTIVYIVLDLLN